MRLSLHKLPLKGEFGCGLVAGVLAVYFLAVFPAVQFFLRPITPFAAHAYSLYLAAALLFLVVWKKIPPQRLALAWPPPRSHVVMGAVAAALPVLARDEPGRGLEEPSPAEVQVSSSMAAPAFCASRT